MKSIVRKWGNSLAVRIPRRVAEHVGIEEGTELELLEERGAILIKPTSTRISLRKILRAVRADNLHGEISTGRRTDKEVW
jgi:antitoxin MazE